ncbi:ATP-binding protein [Vibrio sp. AK197]
MAKIFFICGFIGSGKTHVAHQLAKQTPAFRFTIDEWMIPLFGEHMEREVFDGHLATLKELFKRSSLELLALDVSVVLDFGFWTRRDRAEFRRWALEHQIEYEFVYLNTDFDTCCKRALARNKTRQLHTAYEMTPEMLNMFWSWFEPPAGEELATMRVINNRCC